MGENDPNTIKPSKEGDRKKDNVRVVKVSLDEARNFVDNPQVFKQLFIRQFPGGEIYFRVDSNYAFRGVRAMNQDAASYEEYSRNIRQHGIEFEVRGLERPAGIYLQPGEKEDSFERSVGFAFGGVQTEGDTELKKPKLGDTCVFSVYKYREDGKDLVDRESRVYPGEGASFKKFVPLDRSKKWNDLLVASIIFQIS